LGIGGWVSDFVPPCCPACIPVSRPAFPSATCTLHTCPRFAVEKMMPSRKSPVHWPSVWQLVLSVLGILGLWGVAALMLVTTVSAAFSGDTLGATAILLNAAGLGFSGVLLIPSAGYALMRLLGKPFTRHFPLRYLSWIILFFPLVILLGHFASRSVAGGYLFLPVFHILAALIPVIWLLSIGLRGLPTGSQQRSWGVFGIGMVGAPLLSLLSEAAVLLILGMFVFLYLMQDPEILDFFLAAASSPVSPDPEVLIKLVEPYLMRPGTLYLVLVFGALLVPLLEEMFKPIGVWLLAGRGISAAEGFAAGLLSGAGYALFENFTLSAGGGGDGWAMTAAARTGTSLVHMLTTGLVGWALALAWRERRYLRLAGTYLLAILIHGMWNTMVILTAVSGFSTDELPLPDALALVGDVAPFVIAALLIFGLLLLLRLNASFRKSVAEAQTPHAPSPDRAIMPPAVRQPAETADFEKDLHS